MSKEINEGEHLIVEVIDGSVYCADEDCPCPPTDRLLSMSPGWFSARELMDAANAHAARNQFARL